ncbi:MAG: SIMPL domain-containing protein [Nitrosotalea sp.]
MTTQKKTMLATIAAILIVSTAIFASLEISQQGAYGQQATIVPASRERTASVTGSATASIAPDMVTVQFGVDTQAKTAKDAISTNAKMMNAVVSAVQNTGITKDEISTAGFSIYPVYNDTVPDPATGVHKSILAGYQTSNTLYVKTTKLSLAGSVVDAAVSAGANRVDNISFSLSPDKQQSMQDSLLGQAVLNAQSRAEKVIDPLGQKIIGVKMVNLSEFNTAPVPMYYGAMSMATDKSTPVFTANQQVTTTVDVTFLIGDK